MSLSLCLIFKDEMSYLPDAISSVEKICDEFILVDSGSKDGSSEWAKQKAASDPRFHYYLNPWPGNFSEQRNFALCKASKDWILVLDADERLEIPKDFNFRAFLAKSAADAYSIEILNYTHDFTEIGFVRTENKSWGSGYVPTRLHRLFKRDPRIVYSGILHERIEPALEEHSLRTASIDLKIHHLGKIKEMELSLRDARLEFYEELAQRKVKNSPWDAQSHWELGVVLQKQRRMDLAELSFKRAFDLAPEIDEFESYYLLSLYQQNAWPRIMKHPPRSKRGEFFLALAKAESDQTAIDKILEFSGLFSQAPLMAFEVSLRRGTKAQIEKFKREAEKTFANTGLIEFLEGGLARVLHKFHDALAPLSRAVKLRQPLAYQDYLICLIKTEQMPKVVEFFRSLGDSEQLRLSEDSLKMIDLAHLSLGMGRDRVSELRARFKKT